MSKTGSVLVSVVDKATGLARSTVERAIAELELPGDADVLKDSDRVRRPGAGRKPVSEGDPSLGADLERLVDPVTRGDPMSPLRWTCKSTRRLAQELGRAGHKVSHETVARELRALGYSLQANRKTLEGSSHPDRNAQFEFIAGECRSFQKRGQPVISVDTKKKELVGTFKNGGRDWEPSGRPQEVQVHDFMDEHLGKVVPYGVYDLARNQGWVSVGVSSDTAEFAVETIGQWWREMGRRAYPKATELLVTADNGGSNSSRCRLWKVSLQALANRTGLAITVRHFPPGTSKWNKIEHRMFCHITQNWRGRPLVNHEVVVSLIANTTTREGLRVKAKLDSRKYEKGIKVPPEELKRVNMKPAKFHAEWNYTIRPNV